jgi:O-antigen/teichoic acid export membrane protein
VTGSGALVNIVSNFLLIPFWGIMGAALATLFSYITMALALFYFSQKVYRIKYEYGKIARLMSLIFSSSVAYYLLYYNGILNIPIKILLLFVFVTILFIAKIVDINELSVLTKRLVKRK